jgi:hypothetical protein
MSVPLRHADLEPRYSAFDADDRDEDAFALSPNERIGGPVSESVLGAEASNALAWSISVAIIVCAGWVLINRPASWPSWVSHITERALAAVDQRASTPQPTPPAQHPIETASTGAPYGPPQPSTPAPLPVASTSPSPPVSPKPPAASPPKLGDATAAAATKPEASAADKLSAAHEPVTAIADKDDAGDDADDTASDTPSRRKVMHDTEASDLPAARLERPKPRDRIEARAESVGLHPGLSHDVLARFSSVDFRNAQKAIDTAIARTPDNGVFIWPQRREPGRALFRVHFVPGAGPDCRRYVVTVTMNGWTTTALPMEKCGVRRVTAQR